MWYEKRISHRNCSKAAVALLQAKKQRRRCHVIHGTVCVPYCVDLENGMKLSQW